MEKHIKTVEKKQNKIFFLKISFAILLICTSALSSAEPFLEEAKRLYFIGKIDDSEKLLIDNIGCCNGEETFYLALISESRGDDKKTFNYYYLSANNEFLPSMKPLSRAYRLGVGVDKDLMLSIDWDRKANDIERKKDNRITFSSLSDFKKIDILNDWNKKAKKGDPNANYRLARIYDEGLLVEQNLNLAFKYYLIASELGHNEAMIMISYFYCKGVATKPNKDKANYWLKKSNLSSICK